MTFFSVNICSTVNVPSWRERQLSSPGGVLLDLAIVFKSAVTLFPLTSSATLCLPPGLSATAWNIGVFTLRQNPSRVQAAGWQNQIKTLWILKMILLLVLSPVIKAGQLSSRKQSAVRSTTFPISTLKTCVRDDGSWVLQSEVRVIGFYIFMFQLLFFSSSHCSFRKIVAHYGSS